jgi:hypothetical protein
MSTLTWSSPLSLYNMLSSRLSSDSLFGDSSGTSAFLNHFIYDPFPTGAPNDTMSREQNAIFEILRMAEFLSTIDPLVNIYSEDSPLSLQLSRIWHDYDRKYASAVDTIALFCSGSPNGLEHAGIHSLPSRQVSLRSMKSVEPQSFPTGAIGSQKLLAIVIFPRRYASASHHSLRFSAWARNMFACCSRCRNMANSISDGSSYLP